VTAVQLRFVVESVVARGRQARWSARYGVVQVLAEVVALTAELAADAPAASVACTAKL